MSKSKYYYAVKEGLNPGLYFSWDDCKDQIFKYPDAVYKKFSKREDAQKYLNEEIQESDLKLTQEETANLSINDITLISYIKNDKSLLNLMNLNKFGDSFYIFTDGSNRKVKSKKDKNIDIKSSFKKSTVSSVGIYFGSAPINISQIYPDKTNNFCELIAIKFVIELLDTFKKEIKEIQKSNQETCFYIVSIQNIV